MQVVGGTWVGMTSKLRTSLKSGGSMLSKTFVFSETSAFFFLLSFHFTFTCHDLGPAEHEK